MEYNSHVWAGAARSVLKLIDCVQERAKVFINDSRVFNSIGSLEHRRNVSCVPEIKRLVPDNHIFLRNTSYRVYPFVVFCSHYPLME